jgi:hypothetical protein
VNVDTKKLWNWIHNVCTACPHDSGEGLCINATDTYNTEDSEKLNLINEYHSSPLPGIQDEPKPWS